MCLAGCRLSVAEGGATEALDRHLDESLDARELQHVVLCGARLKDHVVREQLRLLTGTRGIALEGDREGRGMD